MLSVKMDSKNKIFPHKPLHRGLGHLFFRPDPCNRKKSIPGTPS